MKRRLYFTLAAALMFLVLIACGPKTTTPKAGSASPDDMLSMMPSDVQGVLFINMQKAMGTKLAQEAIEKAKKDEDLQNVLEATGISLEKDLYYAVIGVTDSVGGKSMKGVSLINLKYDKGAMIGFLKKKAEEKGQQVTEKVYEGITLYNIEEEDKEEQYLAFFDESNILVGSEAAVTSCIDVANKKKDNVFKNEELSKVLAKADKNAMFWGAFLIPSGKMEQAASQNPMMKDLKSVKAVTVAFDQKGGDISAEINVMSSDPTKTKQLADFFTGLKGLGGMMAGEKPELADLLNKIEIVSKDDYVGISATIPEALINSLSQDTEKNQEKEEETAEKK